MAAASTAHFFTSFVEGTLGEPEFIQQLQKFTTAIQKAEKQEVGTVHEISQALPKIGDDVFNKNIELFLKFALYISNRFIYKDFERFSNNFDLIEISPSNGEVNVLSLYVIKRVYHSDNHKVILLFVNSALREQKQIEKKLVLLEVYPKILPLLEKRELFLPDILPTVLMVINEALQKFLKYRQQLHDNSLNENNQVVKVFMDNFQPWTVSFFKRIFLQLSQLPEMKQNTKQNAIKELFTLADLYEYDRETDNYFPRPEQPALLVKHFVLLFLFDLLEGILEAHASLSNTHLMENIIIELEDLALKMVNDCHSNKLELIENYLGWVRHSQQRSTELPRQFHRYEKTMIYNPVAIGLLAEQTLCQNLEQNKHIRLVLTPMRKIQLLIGMLYEESKWKQTKCNIKDQLVKGIANILSQQIQLPKKIQSATYFVTPFHQVLLELLEKAGSVQNENEKLYLLAWKNAQMMFTFDVWSHILSNCVKSSQNYPLLSHLINNFRSQMVQDAKNNTIDKNVFLRSINLLYSGMTTKLETGTVDQKILLMDSLILMLTSATMIVTVNDEKSSVEKWKKGVLKIEKEILQSLDYLNLKKQENEKEKEKNPDQVQSTMVYQQLLASENQIQITQYNLQTLKEKLGI